MGRDQNTSRTEIDDMIFLLTATDDPKLRPNYYHKLTKGTIVFLKRVSALLLKGG